MPGASFGTYTIEYVGDVSRNFGDGASQLRRLPGADGAWDDNDDDPAHTPAGRLTISFTLVAEERAQMDEQRDEVRALTSYGLQRLEIESLDPATGTRYTYARVVSVGMDERKDKHTDLMQPCNLIFEVPTARLYQDAYCSWKLGEGFDLGDGKKVGEGALEIACSGVSTTFAVTNNGNAMALAKVSVMPPTGESCENPKVQRIYNGVIADEIAYAGVIAAEDELFVDGRRHYAALAGDSVFGPNFSYVHPAFFRLQPGPNSIRVLFANAGDEADVRLWFRHTWR